MALTVALTEAVVEAIYAGVIDDFMTPDGFDETAPVFSGEFDALKEAILNIKDQRSCRRNNP
jgi:hypothetical protein